MKKKYRKKITFQYDVQLQNASKETKSSMEILLLSGNDSALHNLKELGISVEYQEMSLVHNRKTRQRILSGADNYAAVVFDDISVADCELCTQVQKEYKNLYIVKLSDFDDIKGLCVGINEFKLHKSLAEIGIDME